MEHEKALTRHATAKRHAKAEHPPRPPRQ
jgi:hypothetical protein